MIIDIRFTLRPPKLETILSRKQIIQCLCFDLVKFLNLVHNKSLSILLWNQFLYALKLTNSKYKHYKFHSYRVYTHSRLNKNIFYSDAVKQPVNW